MNLIGNRLKEERVRLGSNQEDFAAIGGVQRRAQGNYERGERLPDAGYLARIAKHGADIQYIVTGKRVISEEQHLDDLRRLSDAWETLELALKQTNRTLNAAKKRKGAEALYQAGKASLSTDKDKLTELVMRLAA